MRKLNAEEVLQAAAHGGSLIELAARLGIHLEALTLRLAENTVLREAVDRAQAEARNLKGIPR